MIGHSLGDAAAGLFRPGDDGGEHVFQSGTGFRDKVLFHQVLYERFQCLSIRFQSVGIRVW